MSGIVSNTNRAGTYSVHWPAQKLPFPLGTERLQFEETNLLAYLGLASTLVTLPSSVVTVI
jgi:hypothetical protein